MYPYPYNTDNNTPVSYLGPVVIRSHSSNKGDWTTEKDLSSNHQIRNNLNSHTCNRATGYLQARLLCAGGWKPLGINCAETAEEQLLSSEVSFSLSSFGD